MLEINLTFDIDPLLKHIGLLVYVNAFLVLSLYYVCA